MSEILKQKIRKDLNRWSRKLLLCVGLESIGRGLVGEVKWEQIYPLQQVWQQENISDFDPNEEVTEEPELNELTQIDPSDTTKEEVVEENNDFLDNIFNFLPYWYFINRAFGVPTSGTANNSLPEDNGQISGGSNNNNHSLLDVLDNQRLLFLQSLEQRHRQQEQQNESEPEQHNSERPFPNVRKLSFLPSNSQLECLNNGHSNSSFNGSQFLPANLPAPQCDEPLDLSTKVTENMRLRSDYSTCPTISTDNCDDGLNTKSTKNPQSKTAEIITRGQRTGKGYTAEELDAALKDIQSGKLGTRRAAVIYGIPRSTLRNKVYKLGKDRNRISLRQRTTATRLSVKDNSLLLQHPQPAANEETVESQPTLQMNLDTDNADNTLNTPHTFAPYYSLRQKRHNYEGRNSDSLGIAETISHEKKVLKEWLRTKLSRKNSPPDVSSLDSKEVSSVINLNSLTSDESSDGENEMNLQRDVILKIPSVINKSPNKINASRRQNFEAHEQFGASLSHTSVSRVVNNNSIGINYWRKRASEEAEYNSPYDSEIDSNNGFNQSSENAGDGSQDLMDVNYDHKSLSNALLDTDEKKSRPKRGKYRNYDKDALLKAVKAVQNGEMSVHRAGSYYGVPHSTLEYKVKERHLLRRPKRKGAMESPKSNQKSSPDSSLSGSEVSRPRNDETNSGFQLGCDSNSLPLPSDLRESLSRYLNINNASLRTYSPPSSPEINSGEPNFNGSSGYLHNDHDSGPVRASSAPFSLLNSCTGVGTTVESAIEQSCLLDLSKKI